MLVAVAGLSGWFFLNRFTQTGFVMSSLDWLQKHTGIKIYSITPERQFLSMGYSFYYAWQDAIGVMDANICMYNTYVKKLNASKGGVISHKEVFEKTTLAMQMLLSVKPGFYISVPDFEKNVSAVYSGNASFCLHVYKQEKVFFL